MTNYSPTAAARMAIAYAITSITTQAWAVETAARADDAALDAYYKASNSLTSGASILAVLQSCEKTSAVWKALADAFYLEHGCSATIWLIDHDEL